MDRNLIEALNEPAFVVRDGALVMSNLSARTLLGEWIDGSDIRLVLRQPRPLERLLAPVVDEGEEVELTGLRGDTRRWLMRLSPLSNGGKLARLFDRSEAYAAEKMRVDFVANASHELRTPLATLIGFTETLIDQDDAIDGETRRKFIGIIHDEAERMRQLVEDLISLSRIEAERFKAPREAVDATTLVLEGKQNWSRVAEDNGNEIVVEANPELPMLAGDRRQLAQLLDNLLSNALRYGGEGGRVFISLAREGSWVRLSVTDEGEGIAAEHLPRITERFYRVSESRSRQKGGTGLGLAIVKHIVERHLGRLTIDSAPGKGTTVSVLLPIMGETRGTAA